MRRMPSTMSGPRPSNGPALFDAPSVLGFDILLTNGLEVDHVADRAMSDSKLRWGILGTASIARKNWQAIRNAGNSTVTAVASRAVDRARAFIDECQANAPMGSVVTPHGRYEALLADPNVDAVYVPLPTGLRKEWVTRAANAGKHVICEKPCSTSVADLRDMIAACERNGVQFMDGVMFMHSERLPKIRAVLDDGQSIGRLRRISSIFSFCAADEFLRGNIRMHSQLEPFGCLGDLGWYCIRFILWAVNWEMPAVVTARLLASQGRGDSPDQVPMECSAELVFRSGVSASFYCSFQTENQQFMTLSGTKGYLHLPDFVLPFFGSDVGFEVTNSVFNVRGCDFDMEPRRQRIAVNEYSNSTPNAQEANLFRNFARQVKSGRLNQLWPEVALKTQLVMEAVAMAAVPGVPGSAAVTRGQPQ
jgi:predicted dehydrogenase